MLLNQAASNQVTFYTLICVFQDWLHCELWSASHLYIPCFSSKEETLSYAKKTAQYLDNTYPLCFHKWANLHYKQNPLPLLLYSTLRKKNKTNWSLIDIWFPDSSQNF